MKRKHNYSYIIMALIPPLMAMMMWLFIGLPPAAAPTATHYTLQVAMTLITICAIPTLLKFVTPTLCGPRYPRRCMLRMIFLMLLAVANILIFWLIAHHTSFFYLGSIAWLTMLFAFPATTTDTNAHNA